MRVATMLALPLMAMGMSEWAQFEQFKVTYGKTYKSLEEEGMRFKAFQATLKRIADSRMGTQGVTKFSDLTPEEFSKMYLTRKRTSEPSATGEWDGVCTACKRFPGNDRIGANASFDWTTKGAVTHVKNQGQCGSCWSFGTTGDIEGVWFLAGHPLTALSEQQLVSCDKTDDGCGGGLQEQAFEYVIKNGGIVAESTYPYHSGDGIRGACKQDKLSPVVAKISEWYQVSKTESSESNIETQLPQVGPITIGIDANHGLQEYRNGIFNPTNCPNRRSSLDHAVMIVGFGEEDGKKYWKIKNSWGPNWGEDGYFRIVRGENKCGVAMDAVHSKA